MQDYGVSQTVQLCVTLRVMLIMFRNTTPYTQSQSSEANVNLSVCIRYGFRSTPKKH